MGSHRVRHNWSNLAAAAAASKHVWMWELDHKEGWLLRNSCFWTLVLEKTLESPLDCKEIKQSIQKEINPEYSLEELMLKLKLQYSGHLMWRANSLEKTLMLGKIEGRRRRGRQRINWLDGITDSMDLSLSKLANGEGRGAWCAVVQAVTKSPIWLSDWTTTKSHQKQKTPYIDDLRSQDLLGTLHALSHICQPPCPSPSPGVCPSSSNFHWKTVRYILLLCPFYKGGLRHREVRQLVYSHTASKWQSQDRGLPEPLIPSSLTSKLDFFFSFLNHLVPNAYTQLDSFRE